MALMCNVDCQLNKVDVLGCGYHWDLISKLVRYDMKLWDHVGLKKRKINNTRPIKILQNIYYAYLVYNNA